jgi:hypothetical protein
MKFWQAMKIVDDGGRVKRNHWAFWVEWCGLVGGRVVLRKGEDFEVYEPSCSDFTSRDWIEVDSESFIIEALPRTVVYTLQDGDIDPDTGDVYLEEDDE